MAAIAAALLATVVPVSAVAVQSGGGTQSVTDAGVGQDPRYQRRDWCGDPDWLLDGRDARAGRMIGRDYGSTHSDAYDERWCSPAMREVRNPRWLDRTDRQSRRFDYRSDRWDSSQLTVPLDRRNRSLSSNQAGPSWSYDCW
jgi:hypothetical protein